VQEALLGDRQAPAAVIPLFNLTPDHPEWLHWQRYYLDNPEKYPDSGHCPVGVNQARLPLEKSKSVYRGEFLRGENETYQLIIKELGKTVQIITERPEVAEQLTNFIHGQMVVLGGRYNLAGNWLVVEATR
jgi:hypothetical protein